MYCITEQQIEFVLDDLKLNGIEREDLRYNLLDHICCMAEHMLEDGADFERFYREHIHLFYQRELRELEEETTQLLTFKNYFFMKKTLLVSGAMSVLAFVTGSILKILHLPGAAILLSLGILSLSFLFLPLLFILKAKEVNTGMQRLVIALGTLLGMLFCLNIMFSFNRWPGANILWFTTIGLTAFVFIPLYFFSGTRRPETRTNTILTSTLLFGFTGLLFTVLNLRPTAQREQNDLSAYLRTEAIWKQWEPQYLQTADQMPGAGRVLGLSNRLKNTIQDQTGINPLLEIKSIQSAFHREPLRFLGDDFRPGGKGIALFSELQQALNDFCTQHPDALANLDKGRPFTDMDPVRLGNCDNLYMLNCLTQLQLQLATYQQSRESRQLASHR